MTEPLKACAMQLWHMPGEPMPEQCKTCQRMRPQTSDPLAYEPYHTHGADECPHHIPNRDDRTGDLFDGASA